MELSDESAVVTEMVPVAALAVMLPASPVTEYACVPCKVRVLATSNEDAFTVTEDAAPAMVTAPELVVMVGVEASGVVMVTADVMALLMVTLATTP